MRSPSASAPIASLQTQRPKRRVAKSNEMSGRRRSSPKENYRDQSRPWLRPRDLVVTMQAAKLRKCDNLGGLDAAGVKTILA